MGRKRPKKLMVRKLPTKSRNRRDGVIGNIGRSIPAVGPQKIEPQNNRGLCACLLPGRYAHRLSIERCKMSWHCNPRWNPHLTPTSYVFDQMTLKLTVSAGSSETEDKSNSLVLNGGKSTCLDPN